MRRIAEDTFVNRIHGAYGDEGTAALREVIRFVLEFYSRFEPVMFEGELYVVRALSDAKVPVDGKSHVENAPDRWPRKATGILVVELLKNGDVRITEDARITGDISDTALAYHYSKRQDSFLVKGTSVPVVNPSLAHASVFARPTFSSLREALLDYKVRTARMSTCPLLSESWFDTKRLFLRRKPEVEMRRSLHEHLRIVLRDAEVRPEQNVDETHPIDIKVTWQFTTRLALIEIKWLGQSREADKLATGYSEGRAREGAKQLSDYLDSNKSSAPHLVSRGYLVVIDARRRNLREDTTALTTSDGFHYEHAEIAYDPKYHEMRDDFDEPIRMFVEPICDKAA
jgi:hypothetical protein